MVQRVAYHQFTGNTVTLGAGTSRVIMGADSGNLKIQDSQSNTTIIGQDEVIKDFKLQV